MYVYIYIAECVPSDYVPIDDVLSDYVPSDDVPSDDVPSDAENSTSSGEVILLMVFMHHIKRVVPKWALNKISL